MVLFLDPSRFFNLVFSYWRLPQASRRIFRLFFATTSARFPRGRSADPFWLLFTRRLPKWGSDLFGAYRRMPCFPGASIFVWNWCGLTFFPAPDVACVSPSFDSPWSTGIGICPGSSLELHVDVPSPSFVGLIAWESFALLIYFSPFLPFVLLFDPCTRRSIVSPTPM